jgi:hypothetical protein
VLGPLTGFEDLVKNRIVVRLPRFGQGTGRSLKTCRRDARCAGGTERDLDVLPGFETRIRVELDQLATDHTVQRSF